MLPSPLHQNLLHSSSLADKTNYNNVKYPQLLWRKLFCRSFFHLSHYQTLQRSYLWLKQISSTAESPLANTTNYSNFRNPLIWRKNNFAVSAFTSSTVSKSFVYFSSTSNIEFLLCSCFCRSANLQCSSSCKACKLQLKKYFLLKYHIPQCFSTILNIISANNKASSFVEFHISNAIWVQKLKKKSFQH